MSILVEVFFYFWLHIPGDYMSEYDISAEANLDLMNRKPRGLYDLGVHGAFLMPILGISGVEVIWLIGQA